MKPGDVLTNATIKGYRPIGSTKMGQLVADFFDSNGNPLYYDSEHLMLVENATNNDGLAGQWSDLTLSSSLVVPNVLYSGSGSIADMNTIYLRVFVRHTAETGATEIFYDEMRIMITYAPKVNKSSLQGIIAWTDYYPYGLPLGNKYTSGDGYRYGYQGQFAEADPETSLNSFELRMYDPAIGRWLSVDPMRQYPSPYVGMGNDPVSGVDPDGGLKDDYKVDKKGNVTFLKKTKDNHDVLYNEDKTKSIIVEIGILNKVKSAEAPISTKTKYDYISLYGDNSATKLFEFLAKNTKVEWS